MNSAKGKFYSIGTGPGDPELLTLKAVATIKSCAVIAVPDSGAAENAALEIVRRHLDAQRILCCEMPMTRDRGRLESCHQKAAVRLAALLDAGENVGFLTLGDPTVYSTALYVHQKLQAMGYETQIIPGVPSFCAAAARLNVPLCEGGEMLHLIPASYPDLERVLGHDTSAHDVACQDSRLSEDTKEGGCSGGLKGSLVLMKSGKSAAKVKALLNGRRAMAVERCGMVGEKVHSDLSTWSEDASYFSILLVKGNASGAENIESNHTIGEPL